MSAAERLQVLVERLWLCGIRGRHFVKMGSYPACYRCGRVRLPLRQTGWGWGYGREVWRRP